VRDDDDGDEGVAQSRDGAGVEEGAGQEPSDGVPRGTWDAEAAAPPAAPPGGCRPSDEELLNAWRAGDARSGQRLWRRHSDSVRRFFRNKVPWAVALDLTQRTVEACLRAQDRIRSFRSYVLSVATRQLFDHLRTEHRKKQRDSDLETLVIEDTVASPEEWVGAKREKRVLLRALRRLPLPQQLVLELRYWEQLSDRDIAEVLAWPAGTVKTRLSTGKRALRAQIKQLTESPEQLHSTLDSFDQWAARTRKLVVAPALQGQGDGTPEELAPEGELADGSAPIEPEDHVDDEDDE
jgi:RNA polymerase sigma-70 factor, ECF subfamily